MRGRYSFEKEMQYMNVFNEGNKVYIECSHLILLTIFRRICSNRGMVPSLVGELNGLIKTLVKRTVMIGGNSDASVI